MAEATNRNAGEDWLQRWRASRATIAAVLTSIVTLPMLARLLRWRRDSVAWMQDVLGAFSGLVWGRIGWIGVRRYGFSNEDAFLAGGLAGAVTPAVTSILRHLGWTADFDGDRSRPGSGLLAWLWGFLAGGAVAAAGALVARIGRPRNV